MIWKRKTPKPHFGSKSWQAVSFLGTLGWNLIIPIITGTFAGRFLDQKFNQDHFWTLSLLTLGVMITFYNLFKMTQGEKK